MAKMSKTWWGNTFIEALINFMDEGRLMRGRSYSGPNRILSLKIIDNKINAKVRGNANPYYGVYTEPKYKIFIEFKKINEEKWNKIIKEISINAGWISSLMLGEIPHTIERAFKAQDEYFLPQSLEDIETECSCPDWSNPCKHIAGVYYKIASFLDEDPFLLFQLRGITKDKLLDILSQTELGKFLVNKINLNIDEIPIQKDKFYYTDPGKQKIDKKITIKDYWNGYLNNSVKINDNGLDAENKKSVPAILIKKQTDYPSFWNKDKSFIETMEEIYGQIRKGAKKII